MEATGARAANRRRRSGKRADNSAGGSGRSAESGSAGTRVGRPAGSAASSNLDGQQRCRDDGSSRERRTPRPGPSRHRGAGLTRRTCTSLLGWRRVGVVRSSSSCGPRRGSVNKHSRGSAQGTRACACSKHVSAAEGARERTELERFVRAAGTQVQH